MNITPTIAQFVDTTVFGGAEAIATQLCAELSKRGFDSVIYHFDSPDLIQRCSLLGIDARPLADWPLYKSSRSLPKFCWNFARRLRNEKVNLLHSHLLGAITAGSLSAFLARIPNVGTLHDFYTLEDGKYRMRTIQACSLLGTRLVTVANALERYCRERAWFSRSGLRTIHNGIERPSSGLKERSEIRQSLGIDPTAVVVVTVGRLVELKRQELLIKAVGQLSKDDALQLLIVGDGPERQRLDALAISLNVSTRVKFVGFQDNVAPYLSAADIFALVSTTECLSCAVLEAMSHGLPIVATKVGGNEELVTEGQNGLFVDPTAESIAAAFEKLAKSTQSRSEFGARSLAMFEQGFLFEQMISAYLAQYSSLLS